MKQKIMLIILCMLLLLIGCNHKIEEATDKEQYCLDRNMTFDNTYILQQNWTRCCKESTPTDYGTYRTNCKTYQFNIIKNNETEKNESLFLFSNETIGYGVMRIAERPIIDYSETGYYKVNPNEDNKFIFFECENSTLRIKDNMIWCEKD